MAKDMNKFIQKSRIDDTNYIQRKTHGKARIHTCPMCGSQFPNSTTRTMYKYKKFVFCCYQHKVDYIKHE